MLFLHFLRFAKIHICVKFVENLLITFFLVYFFNPRDLDPDLYGV